MNSKALPRRIFLKQIASASGACGQLTPPPAARGASAVTDSDNPDWLRDPARGQYPYSPKGW